MPVRVRPRPPFWCIISDIMIVFDLGCANNHRFEGWFASGRDFDQQLERKLIICPVCSNANVARLPHAAPRAGGA